MERVKGVKLLKENECILFKEVAYLLMQQPLFGTGFSLVGKK